MDKPVDQSKQNRAVFKLYTEKANLEFQNKALEGKMRDMQAGIDNMDERIPVLEEDRKHRIAATTSVLADNVAKSPKISLRLNKGESRIDGDGASGNAQVPKDFASPE
ncbi:hypothetical protein V496_08159 [Pseudogymnoascus sp. VKM F-4515 (FW-2607)]|nr:hypothetical protein V496_08159 [Pseudogymnoascus sp. VKM F-4515 (FW-2607)]KFY98827.1 hypothetical protein V498_01192 [Pseudogymnoascus sp. VKM F-4517 (FW-2822)]